MDNGFKIVGTRPAPNNCFTIFASKLFAKNSPRPPSDPLPQGQDGASW